MDEQLEASVTGVLKSMAGDIASAAPRGWKRAVLHGYAVGEGGAGHRGFRFEPKELNSYGSNDIDVFTGLRELHQLLGAGDRLTVELEVESRGRFRAVLSERLDRSDAERGFRYVLDPESTPPPAGEPHPGPDVPEAGDPEEAVVLLNTFLRRLDEVFGSDSPFELPPPLPEDERQELLDELGVALPRDLLALYATVDGDGGRGLLHSHGWFGLEMLVERSDAGERWWVTQGWRRYVDEPFIKEYGPPLRIRRLRDDPAWIPFATDQFGNFLAVDMAPGPRGCPGQVILIGRDHSEGPVYVADSVTTLLRRHVEALTDSESFQRDDDGLWLNAGDVEQHKKSYDETCVLSVTGKDAAPVRGMRPEIRELAVSNAPWVDLGPVRGAPALWRVSLKNCPGADLSPLLEAPVEVLDLDLVGIDLTGLAGHPTLRTVVLRTEKPVDLQPLRSCSRLYALDLSDAPLADLAVVRELTELQYLKLRRPQWEPLLQGGSLPEWLAVAELAEEPLTERKWYWSFDKAYKSPRPTHDDALAWACRLAGDAVDIRTFKGRF